MLKRLVSNRTDTLPQIQVQEIPQDPAVANLQLPDTRSPLERFRTQPKKALSVTDLVSPAWCELQYWYTLTIHGRKKRTAAMKQGSFVHQQLEDQVHTTVKVDVETKEDAWGLRIWNVIQGLRTLRDTGLTRELEIWGTVDGLVVNGVIDELSYICPDVELDNAIHATAAKNEPAPDQMTISEFFGSKGGATISDAAKIKRREKSKKIYLADVKTRGGRTLPSGAAFKPTKMQLMLYHRLISELAANTVEFDTLAARYNLDSGRMFSDVFIAQVGSLNDEMFYDAQSQPNPSQDEDPWSQDSMTTLLAHNNLSALWSLMISEFQRTMPDEESLGKVLKAEYRSRDTGEIVGNKTLAMDENELNDYVKHEMEWWRGKREPEGVNVEEAYKCRSCDFAESCEWRLKKVEEAQEKARMKRKRTAAV